ncbi:MAG TPA: lysophospholipid acyltransferase family protein [Pirellulaceae bacterium]|nr:lysophospholipid acyltransferase family protein [Pirellulaceae bacterium]
MRKFTRNATDWLVYLAVRVVVCIIQATSIETCQYFAHALGYLASEVLRVRATIVDENLKAVFPHYSERQLRKLKRRMWEHLFLLICEIAHAPRKIHETNWRKYVNLCNKRALVTHLLDERSTILVSGHYGNFEFAGFVNGLLGFPSYSIARPLDNPYLDRFVNRFRSMHGQFILPKEGSAPLVKRVLDSGGTLALLGDQYAGEKGCWVTFLGRLASCHKAVAVFTIAGGAPMAVCYARRTGKPLHFDVGMEGAADPALGGEEVSGIKPLTEWYNRMLEQVILKAPEQYWWVHRRWREPPAKIKKRLAA